MQVISGGAKGIDQTCMLSALAMDGKVVGVMANSLAKTAVAKKYRTAIKEGNLTLISTYDPDAGFSVGNAMGRNKYIYGLADYALVINSTVNKGGTWAGATEALAKIKDVPVFVRIAENTESGNHKLLEKGAIPFTKYSDNLSLRNVLSQAVLNYSSKQNSKIIIEEPSLLDNLAKTNSDNNLTDSTNQTPDQSRLAQQETVLGNQKPQKPQEQPSFIGYQPQDIYQAVLPFILQRSLH